MTVHFGPDDWHRIIRDYTAWWEGQLDRPLLYLANVTVDGRPAEWIDFGHFLTDYPPDTPPQRIVQEYLAAQSNRRFPGDAFPGFFVNFGAGVMSALLGCRVSIRPDTVWFEPIAGATLANLRVAFDPANPWWGRILAVTRTAAEAMGDRVQVKITDMGGITDILASLIGTEQMVYELYDNPARLQQAIAEVRREWFAVYRRLVQAIRPHCPGTQTWAPTWAPGTTYMLQSDFSYMLSPEMFAEFIAPDLEACCELIEYPFYHMDGVGQIPHLKHLLAVQKLRGIQWIPGEGKPPAHEWPDLLRQIRARGKLVQVFTTCDGARKICREVGGRGFLMAIYDQLNPQQAEAFIREIEDLCHP